MAQLKDTTINGTLRLNNGDNEIPDVQIEIENIKSKINSLPSGTIVHLGRTEATSWTTLSGFNAFDYRMLILICEVATDHRILATSLIPVDHIKSNPSKEINAQYGSEYNNYTSRVLVDSSGNIKLKSESQWDAAELYGVV